MKNDKPFLDTNVLLYLLSEDNAKADRAEAIIAAGGIISVQVLNEFASVAFRKLGMSYAEIRDVLATVRTVCQAQALTADTHERGLDIAERFGFSLYDSMIVSSAVESGCTVLYSEDMQHGQEIDGQLVVANPFLDN
ncbi:MAG: PIN domain-containing protein [Methylobacter sp.]|jgi:predicted nucleic acid-binding protein|uniref:PIN domain-containing protein n=1 Tax=Methylobacter sp. TaxID=2051955 RepID=UPI0025E1D14F|nr:PIN domain-containing protein [Methylobacter sp.]MCK9620974.1 PIN domain-containing protein [Methylobacter sp.]